PFVSGHAHRNRPGLDSFRPAECLNGSRYRLLLARAAVGNAELLGGVLPFGRPATLDALLTL
ncbi:MAG: hypothetical protein WCK20_06835, partial [Thermoleophilia bacterium]